MEVRGPIVTQRQCKHGGSLHRAGMDISLCFDTRPREDTGPWDEYIYNSNLCSGASLGIVHIFRILFYPLLVFVVETSPAFFVRKTDVRVHQVFWQRWSSERR